MTEAYRSSIPADAVERVLEHHPGSEKKRAEYLLDGEVVGVRDFHPTGEPRAEYPRRNGLRHGVEYRWDRPGVLLSATPYVAGQEHGTAQQWADDGTLIGTYTMHHGTGLDLWWQERDGAVYLAEARYAKDGLRHGFDWWINDDQRTVYQECHFWAGEPHGIEREWNRRGRLRRGFPRYYVHGQRRSKARYLRAQAADPTLPPFHEQDNAPARVFPHEVVRHLRPPAGQDAQT